MSGLRLLNFPLVVLPRGGEDAAGPYKFTLGADAATDYPDFAVDQGYTRTKTITKSLLVGDPGDTPDIGRLGANGAPGAPTSWAAGSPQTMDYCWPLDTDSKYVPNQSGLSGNQITTYNGRLGQFYWGNIETVTPTARGGAFVISVTMPGTINPVDRGWWRDQGLVLPGRAALEDSGVALPYTYVDFKNIYAPGTVNWYEIAPAGNLHLIASDVATDFAALAIRRADALTNGFNWMVDFTSNELLLSRVTAEVIARAWGFDPDTKALNFYSPTAAKGKLVLKPADSTGDTETVITNAAQAAARVYTVPDAGADASFVMTAGGQTIGGEKIFSAQVKVSHDNLLIGGVAVAAQLWKSVTVTAALLDGAGSVVVQTGVAGVSYRIREILMMGAGTGFGAGGDRTVVLTDGTLYWTQVANADMEAPPAASVRWGDAKLPFLSNTAKDASGAGATIRFEYYGGAADHGGVGNIIFHVLLEKTA